MDWLRRAWQGFGKPDPTRGEDVTTADALAPPTPAPLTGTERSAPGITAVFDGVQEDGRQAILDLGPGSEGSFRLYSRFARRIRFAGLLPDPPRGKRLADALARVPPPPSGLWNLVVAWNLLDRLTPEEHITLLGHLAEITRPGSRLYVLVDTSEEPTAPPLRFTLLDKGRVSQIPTGPSVGTRPTLLPAEVERVLAPFRVEHAFTLRKGWREYVAVRR